MSYPPAILTHPPMNPIITPARNYSAKNRKRHTRARRIGWLLAASALAMSAFILTLFA